MGNCCSGESSSEESKPDLVLKYTELINFFSQPVLL